MAYLPVPSVNAGDLWTAAQHNTYIKDNFAAGVPDIFTTKGDIAVASGADAASRLAIGNTGQVLLPSTGSSVGIAWFDLSQLTFPAKGTKTFQLVDSATDTVMQYAETYDPMNVFTPGATARYIAPLTGYYNVSAWAGFNCGADADTPEAFSLYAYVDGAFVNNLDTHIVEANPTSFYVYLAGSAILYVSAGSYIQGVVSQNSGATLNVDSYINVFRIG